MAERELPSNSLASKEVVQDDIPKRAPVAKGHARKRSKLVGSIIAEDAGDVRSYVMADVVLPAIKDIIFNTIQSTVEMLLFGEVRGGYRRSGSRSNERVGYSRMYRREEEPRGRSVSRGRNMSAIEACVPTRGEAQDVKDEVLRIQDEYDMISVAEFFELCDMPAEYTDRKYGWTDLRDRDIDILPHRGEYIISLPRPIVL